MYLQNEKNGLSEAQINELLLKSIKDLNLKKVLLVPPDITRLNSGAGLITALYYDALSKANIACRVDILPALGTHVPMTRAEQISFFGEKIPEERYLVHNWRTGVAKIGEVPAQFVSEVSEGLITQKMDVEVSNYLLDPSYDLIISIGQVVPHEIVGMANYTKNIVVGCGGSGFINASHMLGAYYGMERLMGLDHSPVRKVFDYAQEHFISKLNVLYALTVTVTKENNTKIIGLYIDKGRGGFDRAVLLSQKHNIIHVEKPIDTCVVWLDEREYRTAWLSNKAIYRTRMAIKDGGRLIVIAPGLQGFGEDKENDKLIRKYGYKGRENIIKLSKDCKELQDNLSVAAHLIHGSSDGRFDVIYAPGKLSESEIKSVGFQYMDINEALRFYNPSSLKAGFNTLSSGDEIYFIENPALGLWVALSM